jgi:hypothetical protein
MEQDMPGTKEDRTNESCAAATLLDQMEAALQANYATVQYHYVQFLSEHLTDCRKTLGGDFDDLMILAVLGQRFLQARQDHYAGDAQAQDRIWMSALRLSDVTGVPRESVRRKLKRLLSRGWVAHDPEKGWGLVGSFDITQARIDLADLDRRGLDRLARLVHGLLPLLPRETAADDQAAP